MNILFFSGASMLVILLVTSVLVVLKKYFEKNNSSKNNLPYFLFQAVKNPFIFFSLTHVFYGIFLLANEFFPFMVNSGKKLPPINFINLINILILFWLTLNLLTQSKKYFLQLTAKSGYSTISTLLPAIHNSLYPITTLFMLNLLIPEMGLSGMPVIVLEKATRIFFVVTLGWIFMQALNVLEKYILTQYLIPEDVNTLASRKLTTQVLVLKRVILSLGLIITLAAILMVFDSVKNLGTGILTTAGIISAVSAFASQQSLSRIFAGLQLAFTQPIRIGDTVIIDNEFGQVEEINLSYVVIKLWDLRRLIKPTDYFTSNGLQNLTRESSQLLGTIFIYTDYTLPVEKLREKYFAVLAQSSLWDGKVKSLDVTDITEKSMQIRALMSAENASVLWDLRCAVREKLMRFLVTNYPECLSKSRNITINSLTENSTEEKTEYAMKNCSEELVKSAT